MYLKINELVRHMQYENTLFNPYEYKFYFKDELSLKEKTSNKELLNVSNLISEVEKNSKNTYSEAEIKNWLFVPFVSETEAIEKFIYSLEKKPKYFFEKRVQDFLNINLFYNVILELDLEEKWEKFLYEYRKEIATKWCLDNGIVYTEKE